MASEKLYRNTLNYDGIEFPVTVKQYNKIEKQNSINVNVFGYVKKQKYPIYISKEQYNKTLNLLLITSEEEESNIKHFVLIKTLIGLCAIKQNHITPNTFVCIVSSVLQQKQYFTDTKRIVLLLTVNKQSGCLKKVKLLTFKIITNKILILGVNLYGFMNFG